MEIQIEINANSIKQLITEENSKALLALLACAVMGSTEFDKESDEVSSSEVYKIVSEANHFDKIYTDFKLSCVDETGGGEGGGEYVERVIEITHVNGEILGFIRITGSYYSHEGIEYDTEANIVEAREVVVTQYFNV